MGTAHDGPTELSATAARPAEASLTESLEYYDRQARRTRVWYEALKVLVIACGAAIPVLTTVDGPAAVTATVGSMVVAIEGVQQLFGFHARYLAYRSAWNLLDRERRLYQSQAGSYAGAADPHRLLAEHIDEILKTESTSWANDAGQTKTTAAPT